MNSLTLELKDARVDNSGDEYYLIDYIYPDKVDLQLDRVIELFLVFTSKNQLWQMAQFGENKVEAGYEIFREVIKKLETMKEKMNRKEIDNGAAKEDTKEVKIK